MSTQAETMTSIISDMIEIVRQRDIARKEAEMLREMATDLRVSNDDLRKQVRRLETGAHRFTILP